MCFKAYRRKVIGLQKHDPQIFSIAAVPDLTVGNPDFSLLTTRIDFVAAQIEVVLKQNDVYCVKQRAVASNTNFGHYNIYVLITQYEKAKELIAIFEED